MPLNRIGGEVMRSEFPGNPKTIWKILALATLSGGVATGIAAHYLRSRPDKKMLDDPLLLLDLFRRYLSDEDVNTLKQSGKVPSNRAIHAYANSYFDRIAIHPEQDIDWERFTDIVLPFQLSYLQMSEKIRIMKEKIGRDKSLLPKYRLRVRMFDAANELMMSFENAYRFSLLKQGYEVQFIGKSDHKIKEQFGIESEDEDALVVFQHKKINWPAEMRSVQLGYITIASGNPGELAIRDVFPGSFNAAAALLFAAVDYAREPARKSSILLIPNSGFTPLSWLLVNVDSINDDFAQVNIRKFRPMDRHLRLLTKH